MKIYLNLFIPAIAAAFNYENIDLDSESDIQRAFSQFMIDFSKSYDNDEKIHRFSIFKDNLKHIFNTNSDSSLTYTLGVNQFADLTQDEFAEKYLNQGISSQSALESHDYSELSNDSSAGDADWTRCMTPVENQGTCSSCWAFSVSGTFEGAACRGGYPINKLSRQELLDCSTPDGNQGCRGGMIHTTFNYILRQNPKGITSAASYPYRGSSGACQARGLQKAPARLSRYGRVRNKSEAAVQKAVTDFGPVAVAISAEQSDLQFYKGGIFNGNCSTQLDHAVVVVGFGAQFFKVKNSWGASWGEAGYVRLARNTGRQGGMCGVTLDVNVAQIASPTSFVEEKLKSEQDGDENGALLVDWVDEQMLDAPDTIVRM